MEERRKQPSLLESKTYQQEAEVEPRVNAGEQSYSRAGTRRGDELNEQNKLLGQILSRANMNLAYERVRDNAGSAGIDKMKTEELLEHLKTQGRVLLDDLFTGRYEPQAVKR